MTVQFTTMITVKNEKRTVDYVVSVAVLLGLDVKVCEGQLLKTYDGVEFVTVESTGLASDLKKWEMKCYRLRFNRDGLKDDSSQQQV